MNIRADMKCLFNDKLLAVGDVYLDERIVLHNVKLVQTQKDGKTFSFVSFPQKQKGDKWEPLVMIKDKDLRGQITEAVKISVMEAMKRDKEPLDMTVDVRLYEKDETRAYATVNYGGLVKIDGIRIFERDGQLRVSYPYEKNGDFYQNLAGPASPNTKNQMATVIIKAYEDKKLEKEQEKDQFVEAGPEAGFSPDDLPPWEMAPSAPKR